MTIPQTDDNRAIMVAAGPGRPVDLVGAVWPTFALRPTGRHYGIEQVQYLRQRARKMARAERRWRHGGGPYPPNATAADWKRLYARRFKADPQALDLADVEVVCPRKPIIVGFRPVPAPVRVLVERFEVGDRRGPLASGYWMRAATGEPDWHDLHQLAASDALEAAESPHSLRRSVRTSVLAHGSLRIELRPQEGS